MYRTICPSCKRAYDAMKASDCDCIEPLRTFRCPNCHACFCRASQSVKREFWTHAPRDLWDRRKKISAEAASVPPPNVISHPLVLFAEDDPVGRAIATKVIATLGVSVVVAKNGEEALQLAREYGPDVIIADALMPKLDGRELSRIIKFERPETKVVVITGLYKDPRYKHEALRDFKVDEFLAKPIAAKDLQALVLRYVEGATAEAEN